MADFTAEPTFGNAPLGLQFLDKSTGKPTRWVWRFGDLSFSKEQNPVWVYFIPGSYTIMLTVYDEEGASDTLTKEAFIQVRPGF